MSRIAELWQHAETAQEREIGQWNWMKLEWIELDPRSNEAYSSSCWLLNEWLQSTANTRGSKQRQRKWVNEGWEWRMKLGKEEGKSPTDNCCDRAKTVKIALKNVQNKGVEGRLLIVAWNWEIWKNELRKHCTKEEHDNKSGTRSKLAGLNGEIHWCTQAECRECRAGRGGGGERTWQVES